VLVHLFIIDYGSHLGFFLYPLFYLTNRLQLSGIARRERANTESLARLPVSK
jgi:hypothetical protein